MSIPHDLQMSPEEQCVITCTRHKIEEVSLASVPTGERTSRPSQPAPEENMFSQIISRLHTPSKDKKKGSLALSE